MVAQLDGSKIVRVQLKGADAAIVGASAAELALEQGAAEILSCAATKAGAS